MQTTFLETCPLNEFNDVPCDNSSIATSQETLKQFSFYEFGKIVENPNGALTLDVRLWSSSSYLLNHSITAPLSPHWGVQ